MRSAKIERKTGETDISLALELDNSAPGKINSGNAFLEHRGDQFPRPYPRQGSPYRMLAGRAYSRAEKRELDYLLQKPVRLELPAEPGRCHPGKSAADHAVRRLQACRRRGVSLRPGDLYLCRKRSLLRLGILRAFAGEHHEHDLLYGVFVVVSY